MISDEKKIGVLVGLGLAALKASSAEECRKLAEAINSEWKINDEAANDIELIGEVMRLAGRTGACRSGR